MRSIMATLVAAGLIGAAATSTARAEDDLAIFLACQRAALDPIRFPAADRTERFLGKVPDFRVRCRGGEKAVAAMATPWVDWSNYWATGDASSKSDRIDAGLPVVGRDRPRLHDLAVTPYVSGTSGGGLALGGRF